MKDQRESTLDAAGLRIALVVSDYHESITGSMRDAARATFLAAGGSEDDLAVIPAPGAFELTALCRAVATSGDYDAAVALGCIITGETPHDRYIAHAVAQGITQITVQTGMPIAFGVLTCLTMQQAEARAGGKVGNKGHEAMEAALLAARAVHDLDGARR